MEGIQISYNRLLEKLEAHKYYSEKTFEQVEKEVSSFITEMDKNNDHELSASEFKLLAKKYEIELTDQESIDYVTLLDKDDNAQVSVSEFTVWYQKPFEEWQSGFTKLDWLRLKLWANSMPQENRAAVKGVRKVSPSWAKVKSLVTASQFVKTTWQSVSAEEEQKLHEEAEKHGHLINTVVFVRHGQSEANAAYDIKKCEPYIFDPTITDKGIAQATDRAKDMSEVQNFQPDLVVASPLRRATHTCELVFGYMHGQCPFIIQPLARESVSGADDIGTFKEDLQKEFPKYDYSLLPDGKFWWYIPEEHQTDDLDLAKHQQLFKQENWEEPKSLVAARCRQLEQWLIERPEKVIGVVSHGSYIERMCGISRIGNGEKVILKVNPLEPLEIRNN